VGCLKNSTSLNLFVKKFSTNPKNYKQPFFYYINIIPGDPQGLPDVFKMKSTIVFIDGGYLSFIFKFFCKDKINIKKEYFS